MIICTRPECQTAAGCKCGRLWDYPVRLSMRTALTEYSDTNCGVSCIDGERGLRKLRALV